MTYIVALNLAVYSLNYIDNTGSFFNNLILVPSLVLKGEVWRLVTYIFIPPQSSILFILFTLYLYYLVGSGLESEWGSFRFNVYYLIGMISTTVAAFVIGGSATAMYLNLSLFLAFAHLYPNFQIRIFFMLPIKIKYLGWLNLAFIAYTVYSGSVPAKVFALSSIINYLVFFGKDILMHVKTGKRVQQNRKSFRSQLPKGYIMHKCTICGITEREDHKMTFRYCADCAGDHEYCLNHLTSHVHIKDK